MPSSSLFLGVGVVLSTLSSTVFANKYTLQDTFDASNWLNEFNFDTNDYNYGFVNYLDHQDAVSANLFGTTSDGLVEFGIDSTTYLDASATGRNSVKFLGNTQYNHGLFILDVKSMPGGCGSWPSFWALGPNPWPSNGEVDIIEGVNNQQDNQYTLHTSTQCTVAGTGQTATQTTTNCALDTGGTAGCAAVDQRPSTYGNGLVTTGGGYYVMEWTSAAIKIWYFSHNGFIPTSLTTSNPDTSEFPPPAANFQGPGCNIDQRFNNMQFVFTNNLCGDWAGNVYGQSTCPQYTDKNGAPLSGMDSCKQYVRENPSTYTNKWQIGSLKAFKASTPVSSSSSSSRSSTRLSTRSSSSTKSSSSSTRSSSTMHTTTSSVRSSSSSVRSSSPVASSTARSSSSVRSSSSSSARATSSTKTSSSSARSTSSSKASSTVGSSSAHSTSSSKASSSVRSSSSTKQSSTSTASIRGLAATTSSAASSSASSTQSSAGSASANPTLISTSNVTPSSMASSSARLTTSAGGIVSVQAYPTSSASSSSWMTVPPYPISNSTTPVTSYPAVNTPCSTSANPAYQTSSIPSYPGYPVSPSSAPGYPAYPNPPSSAPGYPGYPVSASVPAYGAAPYPSQPANNGYGGYPVVTNQPSNGYNGYPPSGGSKTTITTTYTTTYVDVCSTGYTTITTTHPVTYCPTTTPAAQPTPGSGYPAVPPPGFQVTTKVCNYGCGSGPTIVTLTVPCTNCGSGSYPVTSAPSKPSKSHTKTVHTKKTKTTPVVQAYSTKVITMQVVPVPISQYYASVSAAAAASYAASNPSKASAVASYPANNPSKPSVASYPANNPAQTPAASSVPKPPAISGYNAIVQPSGNPVNAASKTGSYPAQYTGAAAAVKVSGLAVSAVAVFAAMIL